MYEHHNERGARHVSPSATSRFSGDPGPGPGRRLVLVAWSRTERTSDLRSRLHRHLTAEAAIRLRSSTGQRAYPPGLATPRTTSTGSGQGGRYLLARRIRVNLVITVPASDVPEAAGRQRGALPARKGGIPNGNTIRSRYLAIEVTIQLWPRP